MTIIKMKYIYIFKPTELIKTEHCRVKTSKNLMSVELLSRVSARAPLSRLQRSVSTLACNHFINNKVVACNHFINYEEIYFVALT